MEFLKMSTSRNVRRLLAAGVMAACLASGTTNAQNGRPGDRSGDGSDRGSDRQSRRERWRRDFDVGGYLKRLDVDQSGTLEKDELENGRTQKFLSQIGVDPAKPIEIESAVKQLNAAAAQKKAQEREQFESAVGPKLTAFGVDRTTAGVSAFGENEKPKPEITSFDERVTGLKRADFDDKTMDEARKIIEGYDRDRSGFLEGDEINRIRWRPPQPSQNDLNSDGRISLLEMAKRLQDRNDSNNDQAKQRPSSSSSNQAKSPSAGAASSSRFAKSGNSKSPNDESRKARLTGTTDSNSFVKYVDGMFAKYDVNKDQKLSGDELKKMRRPLRGDADEDGFISKAEAIDSIQGGSKSSSRTGKNRFAGRQRPTPSGDSGAASSSSRVTAGDSSSLGSLGDLDVNADGQIQMAEFSSFWDEATLQRFRTADGDGNGIISPQEWAENGK